MSDIEREEFEQAVADKWSDSYKFTRFGDEDYYDEVLEGIWQGWQARRQALEGEAIGFLQSSGVSQLSGGHPAKLYPIGATPSPFESSTLVYTHPASRKVVEGEVAGLKAEIRTERDPSDEYDSFLVFVSRGKSEPYLFIPETLDDAILDEVVKRINTHPASAAPDEEYLRALQDAFDIIQADANTEENYGSMCRIGSVLDKLKDTPTNANVWIKCTEQLPTEDAGTDLDMSVTIGTFQR